MSAIAGPAVRTPREGCPYGVGPRLYRFAGHVPFWEVCSAERSMTVPYGVGLAAFGDRNAGLRPQARAVSNRRRRLLASVDGGPYGAKNNPVGTPLPGCPHDSGRFLGHPGTGVPTSLDPNLGVPHNDQTYNGSTAAAVGTNWVHALRGKTGQPELHRSDI